MPPPRSPTSDRAAVWRTRSRPAWLFVVGALHLVALLVLSRLGTWRDRDRDQAAAPQAPVLVWLTPPPAAPGHARARPAVEAPLPPPLRARAQPAHRESQPISVPLVLPDAPTAAAAPAAAAAEPAAPPAAASPPSPLNLTLPRGASAPWRAQRNPALDDDSARSARATFQGRFARDNGGDGIWVEERLDTDRIRFRRGGTCVDMERSRAGTLDPFNNAYSAKPWVAKQPREC